jgi:hypothetical protein
MYKQNKITKTSLKVNQSSEGETIEQKVERIVNNNEPITDGAPIMYTERKDGVPAGHDIRTDRWDVAIDAMDKVSKTYIAKREANIVEMNKKKSGENGGAETTQSTQ